MPAKWSDVQSSAEYQALSPGEQGRLKHRYLVNVISKDPDYRTLPDTEKKALIGRFMGFTDNGKNYTTGEALAEAPHNIAQSAQNLAGNIAQTVMHPIDNIVEPLAGLPTAFIDKIDPDFADQLPGRSAMDKTNAIADSFAKRYGSIAAVKRTFAEDPVGFAADASALLGGTAGAARSMGATGRVAGALQTASNVVNPINVLAAPAGRLMRTGLVEGIRNPTNRVMGKLLGDQAAPVYNAFRSNPYGPEIVEGSVPTGPTSIAGVYPWSAAPLQAAGAYAERRLPAQATNIKNAQNAARLEHINGIEDPANMQAAIDQRNQLANAHYQVANGTVSQIDQPVMDIFNRNVLPDVFNSGTIGERIGINPQLGDLYYGDTMHAIKQAFDEEAFRTANEYGIDAREARAIRDARNAYVQWLENDNPAYGAARRTFAAHSAPIDRMRVVQYLQDKLQDPALGEATPAQRAAAYAKAIDEAPTDAFANETIRNATGQRRSRQLSDLFTPEEMRRLRLPQEDLARELIADSEARAAAPIYGDAINTAVSDAWHISPSNPIGKLVFKKANERVADRLANHLLTPEGTTSLAQNYLTRQYELGQLNRNLGFSNDVNALIRYPAGYNYPQQQQQSAPPPVTRTVMPARQPEPSRGGMRLDPRGPAAQWAPMVAAASQATGVPPAILDAVMKQESGGNHSVISPVGAIGLMQLMPDTARGLHVNPYDPAQNIMGGAKYLRSMYDQFGDWSQALAAYNAGPGAVQKYKGIPPYKETQHYVKTIQADIARRYGQK